MKQIGKENRIIESGKVKIAVSFRTIEEANRTIASDEANRKGK
jgi:hypothetical protein